MINTISHLSNDFAKFISKTKAVSYGDFILKSGKRSNIFFNFGEIFYGNEMIRLGQFFADFIIAKSFNHFDVIFGPAYKGINIVIQTSIALYQKYGLLMPIAYNRKSEKDHAEGGNFIGYDLSLAKNILILDDVITDCGTKYEVLDMLSGFSQILKKVIIVGVDRQEKDICGRDYLSIFKEKTGIDIFSLTTKDNVLHHLKG